MPSKNFSKNVFCTLFFSHIITILIASIRISPPQMAISYAQQVSFFLAAIRSAKLITLSGAGEVGGVVGCGGSGLTGVSTLSMALAASNCISGRTWL